MAGFSALKYNMPEFQPASRDESAIANGAVTTVNAHTTTLNPENPFVWLAGIAAVTLGLVAVSTHARVGNVRAGLDVGTP